MMTPRRTIGLISVTWVLSVVYGTVPLYTSHPPQPLVRCLPTQVLAKAYFLHVNSAIFLVSSVVMIVCYLQIARIFLHHRKKIMQLIPRDMKPGCDDRNPGESGDVAEPGLHLARASERHGISREMMSRGRPEEDSVFTKGLGGQEDKMAYFREPEADEVELKMLSCAYNNPGYVYEASEDMRDKTDFSETTRSNTIDTRYNRREIKQELDSPFSTNLRLHNESHPSRVYIEDTSGAKSKISGRAVLNSFSDLTAIGDIPSRSLVSVSTAYTPTSGASSSNLELYSSACVASGIDNNAGVTKTSPTLALGGGFSGSVAPPSHSWAVIRSKQMEVRGPSPTLDVATISNSNMYKLSVLEISTSTGPPSEISAQIPNQTWSLQSDPSQSRTSKSLAIALSNGTGDTPAYSPAAAGESCDEHRTKNIPSCLHADCSSLSSPLWNTVATEAPTSRPKDGPMQGTEATCGNHPLCSVTTPISKDPSHCTGNMTRENSTGTLSLNEASNLVSSFELSNISGQNGRDPSHAHTTASPYSPSHAHTAASRYSPSHTHTAASRYSLSDAAGHTPRRVRSPPSTGQDIPSRLRAARLLATVCGIFLVCWTPLVLSVIAFYTMGGTFVAISACTTVAVVNSAVNFFIYAAANQDFRQAFKRLICRRYQ
ncbi:G protein-coupled receptor [Elysia marginata]|uniref:G protein-coupled receptor n=1 Tax=Elysia marginata TaxID=1093978 RepID=A0AAV4JNN0_9GAST|nr:G protein-coupled receptor [Elysia marginata]